MSNKEFKIYSGAQYYSDGNPTMIQVAQAVQIRDRCAPGSDMRALCNTVIHQNDANYCANNNSYSERISASMFETAKYCANNGDITK